MPRKTDSSNPADWIYIANRDLEAIQTLADQEIGYELCRSKLAEVIEKVMKAELIRSGWFLARTHDLRNLWGELQARQHPLCPELAPLVTGYAELYFAGRYPGFDLEDPDWPAFRTDLALVQSVVSRITPEPQ